MPDRLIFVVNVDIPAGTSVQPTWLVYHREWLH